MVAADAAPLDGQMADTLLEGSSWRLRATLRR
jgi:hypothetical protein